MTRPNLNRTAKSLIRRAVHRAGYDIARWQPNATPPRGYNASHLSTICRPLTVFDVGVGNGTPPLYEAFPDAHFVLVEPVREYAPIIEAIEQEHECTVYYKAVGSEPGEMVLTVDVDDPEKSSFETWTALTTRNHRLQQRTVEVTTLDSILDEHPETQRPILLKLDTEGHEIEALKGGTRLLEITDFVISEVSVAHRFEGGYRFEDMIVFMRESGFRLADILNIAHARGELEPRHMDVLFRNARRG